jgi:circadian clock protein KaiB
MARYTLKLFVTDHSPRSVQAIEAVEAICKQFLADNHDLTVVDVLTDPVQAEEFHILATPTLLKLSPHPVRKLIGDLSDQDRVLGGLEIVRP